MANTASNYNYYKLATVSVAAFAATPDISVPFRTTNMDFSLAHAGTAGTFEYSFDGTTVHGTLKFGTPYAMVSFPSRVVSAIWFRTADASGQAVRVEMWSID